MHFLVSHFLYLSISLVVLVMMVNGVGGDVCLVKGSSGFALKQHTAIAIPCPAAEPAEVQRDWVSTRHVVVCSDWHKRYQTI